MERLKQKAGVAPAVTTFEGGGDMLINVLNHTLDMGIGELQEIRGQLDAGTIRLLAVVGDERLPQFPDVGTVKEQGIDLSVRKFRGLAGPKGTPPDVIAAWEAAIPKLLDDPAYKKLYTDEQPAARLHPARRIRQVHGRVRQGDRSVSQGVRRHPVMQHGDLGRLRQRGARRSAAGYYLMAAAIPDELSWPTRSVPGLPKTYARPAGGAVARPDRPIGGASG